TGQPAEERPELEAAVLPPVEALSEPGIVEQFLRDPDTGLPPPSAPFDSQPYVPRIGLTALSPVTIGVASSAGRGTSLGGGISAYFTDPLNRHQIEATARGASGAGALDIEDTFGAAVEQLYLSPLYPLRARAALRPSLSSTT